MPLYSGQFWKMSVVSTILVFQCTLIINPARLFHNFQNVRWFVKLWMICNYDAKCILTTLNLYYVEWFVLSWIIYLHWQCGMCFWLRRKTCTVVEWFGQFNETSSWKISPGKFPHNFLSHENSNYEHCSVRKSPLWKFLR